MNRRASIVSGFFLILLGILFLIREIAPQYFQFWDWPFIIIGLGFLFIIWAIASGTGGLAVPGSILAGLGGIFYYQNMTGDWESWTYIWALIPGFVGIGIIISSLIDRNFKQSISAGLILILISAIMLFSFGAAFGLDPEITKYWPALLIALGLISLVRALVAGSKRKV
ncbi:MAG: hypothetical protein RQ728_06515 [Brevefilum sp.]|nr:hypothetical protein [Brevefilum sp.]